MGIQSPAGVTTTRGVLRRFNDFLKLFSDVSEDLIAFSIFIFVTEYDWIEDLIKIKCTNVPIIIEDYWVNILSYLFVYSFCHCTYAAEKGIS